MMTGADHDLERDVALWRESVPAYARPTFDLVTCDQCGECHDIAMSAHVWRRSTFGTHVVCGVCGLLPLDCGDVFSECHA